MKLRQAPSGEMLLASGLAANAPPGDSLLSGAKFSVKPTKQIISQPAHSAVTLRPAISTGMRNFTRLGEKISLNSRRNTNEKTNKNQMMTKSSRYVNEASNPSSQAAIGS